jgi:hypothetical protein
MEAGRPQLLKGIGNVIEGDDQAAPPGARAGVRPSSLNRPWLPLVRAARRRRPRTLVLRERAAAGSRFRWLA